MKKIPGSSLKLVIFSLHTLFIASLALGILLYSYGYVTLNTGQIPWTLNKFGILPILLLIGANIIVFLILIADVLALKRERPSMTKKRLLIVSLVSFSFLALFTILNLLHYVALVLS